VGASDAHFAGEGLVVADGLGGFIFEAIFEDVGSDSSLPPSRVATDLPDGLAPFPFEACEAGRGLAEAASIGSFRL
jgi:hypothetical protein